MTVAAGFRCHDGIVLCADSQESLADYKFHVEKLVTRSSPWTDIAIAGSGNGPLIDAAVERLVKRLEGGPTDYDAAELIIADTLNGLYEKEFSLYPTRYPEDTIIDLLIAV